MNIRGGKRLPSNWHPNQVAKQSRRHSIRKIGSENDRLKMLCYTTTAHYVKSPIFIQKVDLDRTMMSVKIQPS